MKKTIFQFIIHILLIIFIIPNIYSHNYDFTSIDKKIKNASKKVGRSLTTLSRFLKKQANNEAEKARAIYLWMITNIKYDTATLKGFEKGKIDLWHQNKFPDQVAREVLRNRKGVCSGFACLFENLASKMKLKARVLYGWYLPYTKAEDKDYQKVFKGRPDHAWNAVMIDGKWHLLDGATKDFLKDPKEMIKSHYPENPFWQLLEKPVEMKMSAGKTLFFKHFKKYKFKLIKPKEYLIFANGKVTIILQSSMRRTLYGTVMKNQDIKNYSLAEVKWKKNRAYITYDFTDESREHIYTFAVSTLTRKKKAVPLMMIKVIKTKNPDKIESSVEKE